MRLARSLEAGVAVDAVGILHDAAAGHKGRERARGGAGRKSRDVGRGVNAAVSGETIRWRERVVHGRRVGSKREDGAGHGADDDEGHDPTDDNLANELPVDGVSPAVAHGDTTRGASWQGHPFVVSFFPLQHTLYY